MINIAYSDIERWLKQQRWDILKAVNFVTFKLEKQCGFYFGQTVRQGHPPCPFFNVEEVNCKIYDTRPLACRHYPTVSLASSRCKNHIEANKSAKAVLRSQQYRDFKTAFHQRQKICDLLKIVRHFPDEVLTAKLEEVMQRPS